jgi:DNA polymerase kappa
VELIKGEFPLKIRLIGLRGTKLKDLRKPEDPGIKKIYLYRNHINFMTIQLVCKFFEDGNHSPRKRQKISPENDLSILAPDEDNMPGYHEDQWEDEDVGEHKDSEDSDVEKLPQPKKPSSNAHKSPPSVTFTHTGHERQEKNISSEETQTLTCPICTKELQMDNSSFNQHIDFCLSKGEIMRATRDR